MQRLSFGRPAFPGVNARNHHPIFLILVVSMVLGFTGCGGGNPSGGSSSGPGDGGGSGGNPPTTSNSRHAPIRTRYLRTDLPYGQEVFPPHITAYDNVHKLFFVSNATSNRIDVFDAVNESQAGSISYRRHGVSTWDLMKRYMRPLPSVIFTSSIRLR